MKNLRTPPGPVTINQNLGITPPGPVTPVSKNENLSRTPPRPVSINENLATPPPPRTKNSITDIYCRNPPPPPGPYVLCMHFVALPSAKYYCNCQNIK